MGTPESAAERIGTSTAPPARPAATFGTDGPARLIVDRRGTRVWRLDGPAGRVALKTADSGTEAALLIAREAAVLRALDAAGLCLGYGIDGDQAWLATRWAPGRSLWRSWHAAQTSAAPAARDEALHAAIAAATAVADFHARGWRHGDIQPNHLRHDPAATTTVLIDLALAQGPCTITPHVPHRGALLPLTAPETAAALLDDHAGHGVTISTAAEVYTLAASLAAAWLGRWPNPYLHDPSTMDRSAKLEHLATTRPDLTPAHPWPQLHHALHTALDPDPSIRPTATELARALRALITPAQT